MRGAELVLRAVHVPPSIFLASVVVLVLYLLSRRINARKSKNRDEQFAAERGCKPTRSLQFKWPLGLDLVTAAFKANSSGHILSFFTRLIEESGTTFEQILFGSRGIDTIDPENIEAVLSTQFKEFGLGARRATFFPLLGDGIFTQDGASWKHSRELLRPLFSSNRSENFSEIQAAVHKMIASIPEGDGPVDLQPLFFRLTLETTIQLLFGRNLTHLSSEQVSKFADAFNRGQDYLARRGRLGDLYWLIGGSEFRKTCADVHKFVDSMISSALEDSGNQPEKSNKYFFLDALTKESTDPVRLRSQLLNLLLAGRDTTGCMLSWTLRLLANDQRVLQKLRTEISAQLGDRPATQADIKKLSYLNCIMKEVLRLYPSVPVNSRSALVTTTLPVGGGPDGRSPILVRAGEAVGYCVYVMHRRKDIYGDDADFFRPERWEVEGFERGLGWGYLPFNGGPRVCLGQDFALMEAAYTIISIVQTFSTILPGVPPGSPQPDENSAEAGNELNTGIETGKERQGVTLVLMNVEGCWVRLSR
ncbi:cytochrome P450 [Aulographum hederae CBS 113979]|uniref:Cytochrome P450 n=1 Tax=Aulographum hederae CBS 113979 TaxID=1176131 RepID=A0A6G1GVJ2_9PEZI|nr:cytochrome P450 [Aulographum hederae CBS 113979]